MAELKSLCVHKGPSNYKHGLTLYKYIYNCLLDLGSGGQNVGKLIA